jgi:hypothetical protein
MGGKRKKKDSPAGFGHGRLDERVVLSHRLANIDKGPSMIEGVGWCPIID